MKRLLMIVYIASGGLSLAEEPAQPRRERNVRNSWDDPEKSYRHSPLALIGFYKNTFLRVQETLKRIKNAQEGEVAELDYHSLNLNIRTLERYREELRVINDPRLTKSKVPPTEDQLREIEIILKTPIPERLPLPKKTQEKAKTE